MRRELVVPPMTQPPSMTTDLLRYAYAQGFFPMPHPKTGEILWLNPDPRAIIPVDGFHTSRSLQRTLKRGHLQVSIDQDFPGVMQGCSERSETWITDEFKDVYTQLHREGDAHSVEVWLDGILVGGVYGVAIAGAFFAESKFHRVTDGSKVALAHLVATLRKSGMELLEVQFLTDHLATLGAIELPRSAYLAKLRQALKSPARFTSGE